MLRNLFKKTLVLLLPLVAFSACGGLNSTAGKSANGTNLVAAAGGGSATAITSFSPAAGTYAAVPTTVVVNFSNALLDQAGAAAISTYNITCGGSPLASQSVGYQAGLSSAAVTLPSITGLANGTLCTFSVSISLRDTLGNFVIGEHTVSYTISSSGSTNTGTGTSTGTSVWNESATTSYTGAVGNNSGNYFQGVGGQGMVMSGLLVNGGQYVDGVSGLWSNGFASTTTSAGPVQGASAGGFSQLSCPAGYRMTGIFGNSGSYIDSVGIICKTQDQTQTYTSSTFGGSGGTAYSLSCPAGLFVTDLDGTSASYIDEIYLGCR